MVSKKAFSLDIQKKQRSDGPLLTTGASSVHRGNYLHPLLISVYDLDGPSDVANNLASVLLLPIAATRASSAEPALRIIILANVQADDSGRYLMWCRVCAATVSPCELEGAKMSVVQR